MSETGDHIHNLLLEELSPVIWSGPGPADLVSVTVGGIQTDRH